MSRIPRTVRSPLAIVLIVLPLVGPLAEQKGRYIDAVNNQTVVCILVYDSLQQQVSQATGIFLWNYQSPDSIYLMSARHVFEKGEMIDLRAPLPGKGWTKLLDSPKRLRNASDEQRYLTFNLQDGSPVDLALLGLEKDEVNTAETGIVVVSRSACVFSDSVYVGDRVLAFGLAQIDKFDFQLSGGFFATAGIVSYQCDQSYLIDKLTHPGMSGGIVLRELPSLRAYIYQVIGMISSHMAKHEDYSWVVKIDYVDSIMVRETGYKWDER